MRKILFAALLLSLNFSLLAQTADSLSMLPGNVVDVYYNLATGQKDTVRNNNWHLAFAVRKALPPLRTMQAATVRINDGRGVELFKAPPSMTWNSFDSSNWNTWPQGFNSDTSWDVGAFNEDHNMSNPFDYGWGVYSMSSKDVTGSRMYVVSITVTGQPKVLKKLLIQKIAYDTMWVFTFANLNNTDSTTMTIKKSDFNGKLFAYVNLNSKTIIDREPASNSWDLLFTRYKTLVTMFGQTIKYPVMGVLHNPNHLTAEYYAPDAHTFTPDTSLFLNSSISEMGWDWKVITTTPGAWPIRDSLSYVVKTGDNKYYRMYFTGYFADAQLQYVTFNKTFFSILTSTPGVIANQVSLNVYPNPVSGSLNLELQSEASLGDLSITLCDMSGKTIQTESYSKVKHVFQTQLDLSALKPGLYFVKTESSLGSATRKIIIQ